MNRIRLFVLSLVTLALFNLAAVAANPVLAWNEQVINATRLSRNPPPPAAIFMATFHAAIFDTVNSITHTHQGWLVNDPAPAGISMDAAIAGAAHTVMVALWSDKVSPEIIESAYKTALAEIPEGTAKTEGIAWGEVVAKRILDRRSSSGVNTPIAGPFVSQEPGKWRETPPGFRPATVPHISKVTPFVMTSPDQFRAPPPPAVDSPKQVEDLAYVAKVGARDGAERSEYDTLGTAFWSDDLGTCTPPGHWNLIAQDLATRNKLSVPETARLFALLNMAEADAGMSCWDTKFFYRTWRPETGIRELDTKINPNAKPNPDFIPLMMSPSFPSYTSGHSTFSAAGSRLLERFFGTDEIAFATRSDGLPGAVRSYKRLSDCRKEIGMSRVYGGIHTMSDNLMGLEAGIKIADWVYAKALLPVAAKQ